MKYVLLVMILGLSAPAWARSSTCEEAGQDLRAIERHLFLRTMDGSNCGSRTPAQLGLSNLSPEQTTYFENSRCKNLTQIEEELALLESRLLVSDGLSELRNAVVRNQNTLTNVSNPGDLVRRATTFARDVALGSLIQDLINPQQGLVNEVRQAQGEDWWAKVRSVCGAVANRAKQTGGPRFAQSVALWPIAENRSARTSVTTSTATPMRTQFVASSLRS